MATDSNVHLEYRPIPGLGVLVIATRGATGVALEFIPGAKIVDGKLAWSPV